MKISVFQLNLKHYRDDYSSLFLYNLNMDFVRIGEIINTFGIKGELKVDTCSDFIADRFKKDSTIYISDNYLPFSVESYKLHKGFVMLKLKGFDNINDVLKYKGQTIYKSFDDIKSLEDGEYYFKDLRDLNVYVEDKLVGKIVQVEKGISYNFLRIKKNKEEVLVPYLKQFVLNVDLNNKRVDIVKMDGLL